VNGSLVKGPISPAGIAVESSGGNAVVGSGPSPSILPEPATAGLMAIAGMGMLRRNRR